MRVLLEYGDESLELQPGETSVGRGLACRIRFNDPAVSRQHFRILVPRKGERPLVEDMGSTNGTLINGAPLSAATVLADGDELRVGRRCLRVRVIEHSSDLEPEEETLGGGRFTPNQNPSLDKTPPRAVQCIAQLSSTDVGLPVIAVLNCPACRREIPADSVVCAHCGHRKSRGTPFSQTMEFSLRQLSRRAHARHTVDLPALYVSQLLTFDATARDLSLGGIYLASDLLDPVGTACTVTVLPEGAPPAVLGGMVAHVTAHEQGEQGRPPGMGIKFTRMGPETRRWLDLYLRQLPVV